MVPHANKPSTWEGETSGGHDHKSQLHEILSQNQAMGDTLGGNQK